MRIHVGLFQPGHPLEGGLGPLTGLWQASGGDIILPRILLIQLPDSALLGNSKYGQDQATASTHIPSEGLSQSSDAGCTADPITGPIMALEFSVREDDFWISVGYGHARPWGNQGQQSSSCGPELFGLALRMYAFQSGLKHEPATEHVYLFDYHHQPTAASSTDDGMPPIRMLQKHKGGRNTLTLERIPQHASTTVLSRAEVADFVQMRSLSSQTHHVLQYDSWFAG